MVSKLFRYWRIRDLISEGRQYLEWALATIPSDDTELYAKAMNGAGLLAYQQGDFIQGTTWLNTCLEQQRQRGDVRGMGDALTNLALVLKAQCKYQEAQSYQEEALALYRTIGSQCDIAIGLDNLGNILRMQGDYDRATQCQEEALAIQYQRGDTFRVALVLGNLGVLAHTRGDYARATAYFKEVLALHYSLGNRFEAAITLMNLGENAQLQGQYAQAEDWCQQSIAYFRASKALSSLAVALTLLGNCRTAQGDLVGAQDVYDEALANFAEADFPPYTYKCLLGYVRLLYHKGDVECAVLWLGMLNKWCEQRHLKLDPLEQRLLLQIVLTSQTALEPNRWQDLWEQGFSSSFEALQQLQIIS